MKLVRKNMLTFATGIFWQIPDEGKQSLNFGKLVRDTKNDMFCHIKHINTFGFCCKDELQGEKKVASFGKFIIEASGLSTEYANCIICFKFKNAGEIDDDGKKLNSDLYGYIVLLNGTICPDEGEYVAKIEMVRASIYEKANKYNIETLYLPVDVSGQFFNIFEILDDANNNEELLINIMQNLSKNQQNDLQEFINQSFPGKSIYQGLIRDMDTTILRQLIKEPAFESKQKATQDKHLKYLVPNIFVLSYTSGEIFWEDEKLKKYFTKSLIHPILTKTLQKYKIVAFIILFTLLIYICYSVFIKEEMLIKPKPAPKPPIPKAIPSDPMQLIAVCLANNDQYFKDLGIWTFSSLKCNSLRGIYTFNSDADTTISEFSKLIGKNDNSIKFANKVGIYTQPFKIKPVSVNPVKISREKILSNLQQAAIDYGLKISMAQAVQNSGKLNQAIKFTIASKQSPIFLFNDHVFDNIKLSDISMSFDKNSGFYNWTVQGEF